MREFEVERIDEKTVRGIFSITDRVTANGWVIPQEVMEQGIKDRLPDIDDGRMYGTTTNMPRPRLASQLRMDDVSHIIKKIYQEGDTFRAEIQILDTPMGRVLDTLLHANANLSFNANYYGTNQNGVIQPQDFVFNGIDIISGSPEQEESEPDMDNTDTYLNNLGV